MTNAGRSRFIASQGGLPVVLYPTDQFPTIASIPTGAVVYDTTDGVVKRKVGNYLVDIQYNVIGYGPLSSAPVASADNLGQVYLETGNPLWPNGRLYSSKYVHNVINAIRFFAFASSRRIDIAAIGDSNSILKGYGYDSGIPKKILEDYYLYATPLFGMTENSNSGSGSGYLSNWGNRAICTIPVVDYPVDYSQYTFSTGLTPITSTLQGAYLPSGIAQGGRVFIASEFFKNEFPQKLKYHVVLGKLDGGGSYRKQCRLEIPPYTSLYADSSAVPVASGSGLYEDNFEVTVFSGTSFSLGVNRVGINDMVGPFFGIMQRVELVDRTSGISFTTIGYKGGKSLRDTAEAWISLTQEAVKAIITNLVALQVGDPLLMLRINGGLNDRGDTLDSLGPNPTPSNTENGFYDNAKAVSTIFENAWNSLGFPRNGLYFEFVASHVPDLSDTIIPFRKACVRLADTTQNGICYDFSKTFDYNSMTSNGYYLGGTDPHHLENIGYDALSSAEFGVLIDGSPIEWIPYDAEY